MNETKLRQLCGRIATGDDEARRDFDRLVLPHVEIIVARWLSRQDADSAASPSRASATPVVTLAQLTGAVCARMIAKATNENRPRPHQTATRRPAPALPIGETLLVRTKRATLIKPVSGPA